MNITKVLKKIGIVGVVLLMMLMALPTTLLAAPIAPSNLTAAIAGPRQVDLAWLDNSTDEKNFQIERAGDATFTAGFRTFKVNSVAGTGGTVRFTDNSVVAEQTFFYRVVAIDNAGAVSSASNVVQVDFIVPAAPSNLVAVAVSPTRVELTWTDNAINETSYDVDRDTAANFLTRISFEFQPANSTSFVDVTVQPNTTYFYRVQAVNPVGDSPLSNVVTVTTPALPTAPPSAPTGLVATAVSSTQVNLTWTDTSTTEAGFRIERSTNAVTFNAVGTTGANVATFTDSTVVASTTYNFRVFAFNSLGDSTAAVAAAVTTPATATAPSAPAASFTANTTTGTAPLTVNFSDTSTGTPTSRSWNFGDGSAAVTVQNPTHTFAAAGTFTVTLTATNTIGSSTATQTITVTATPSQPAAGGGGGGGGGTATSPSATIELNGLTSDTAITLNSSGMVTATAKLRDATGAAVIDIAAGTIMKAGDGSVLASISITAPPTVPVAPQAQAIVVAHEFGPSGATFSPAITITLKFDPTRLSGVAKESLVIAFWNSTAWVTLDSTVDASGNAVSAKTTHFTTFALMSPEAASVPETVAPVPVTTPSPTTTAPAAALPSVTITAPANGATLPEGSVTVSISTQNFTLVAPGGANEAGKGHLHYYMDVTIPTTPGAPAVTAAGTYKASPGTSATWDNVKAGTHTFGVQLVNSNHTPLESPVTATVTVTVSAPPPTTTPAVTTPPATEQPQSAAASGPNWVLIGGIIAAVVLLAVLAITLMRRKPAKP